MDRLVLENRKHILALAEKNGVTNVRVFGSMARDNASDSSDVDFLVDLREGKSGFALGGFLMDLKDLLHRNVDVVTEKSLHPRIYEQVIRESIPL